MEFLIRPRKYYNEIVWVLENNNSESRSAERVQPASYLVAEGSFEALDTLAHARPVAHAALVVGQAIVATQARFTPQSRPPKLTHAPL